MAVLMLREPLRLDTRCKEPIENSIDRREPWAGMYAEVEKYKSEYRTAEHRPVGPSNKYNCHGLTFAARRTNIWRPQQILQILKDDEYVEINRSNALVGDIAVYIQDGGDIAHSGIIVRREVMEGLGLPRLFVLSKWGRAHEVVHELLDSPYRPATNRFYRIVQ